MSFLYDLKRSIFPKKEEYAIPQVPFTFPYSEDKNTRKAQIISNLQNSILFEDTGIFLPRNTPYGALDKIAEHKREMGDRIIWYLGHRTILGGYRCHATVMMWRTGPLSSPIRQIEETLGHDHEGHQNLLAARAAITATFGELKGDDVGSGNDLYLGSLNWALGDCHVTLVGIEQFAYKYFLHVGLSD
ncbi:MAG: hypothetical protein GC192_14960 [Bacteroidetes bacterium]|nr:hypothetical protein [Bacteroidota bacterium]